jgi:hypothetical protein
MQKRASGGEPEGGRKTVLSENKEETNSGGSEFVIFAKAQSDWSHLSATDANVYNISVGKFDL